MPWGLSHRVVVSTGGLLLSGAAVLMMGNSGGRAAVGGHGSTGAPGEGDGGICITCHNGGPYGPILTLLEVKQGGQLVASYTPGQTYDVTMTVVANAGNPSGYGFQLTALADKTNANAGTFQNLSANVKESAAANTGGRKYLEHKGGASANGVFTAKWVAPAAKTGTVDFYYIGNVVNGNNAKTGDNGGLGSSITLTERGPGGLPLPYFDPFYDPGGWTFEGDPVSLISEWTYGVEAGLTVGSPETWSVFGDALGPVGFAYLVSEPFDFSELLIDPLVHIVLSVDTEEDLTGLWLEWSDDGVDWTKVGSAGGGTNWYDSFSLQHGEMWSGDSGGWVSAEHAIEGAAGLSNVQLRLVFPTEGSTSSDQVAVDEISVEADPAEPPGPGGDESGSGDGGSDGSTGGSSSSSDSGWASSGGTGGSSSSDSGMSMGSTGGSTGGTGTSGW